MEVQTNENGYTLIEVLIGIVMFSVGILSISTMMTSAINKSSFAGKLTQTSVSASSIAETLSGKNYSDCINQTDVMIPEADLPKGFRAKWSSSGTNINGLIEIEITIMWGVNYEKEQVYYFRKASAI